MSAWRDKDEFKTRVLEWAEKLGVKTHSLALRHMRNKWASCSTAGNLNFNSELLEFDREVGDYVIVHELLHFSVPNHGKLWKSLMLVHIGEFEHFEVKLNQRAHYNRLQRKPRRAAHHRQGAQAGQGQGGPPTRPVRSNSGR